MRAEYQEIHVNDRGTDLRHKLNTVYEVCIEFLVYLQSFFAAGFIITCEEDVGTKQSLPETRKIAHS